MSAVDNFKAKAPKYMKLLMSDFDCDAETAAAVMGNAGYESGGLVTLQEIKPSVKGSRGGYGWFQWTGPRRVKFESYCKRNKLDPAADETNYKYLFVELNGEFKSTMPAVKAAQTLNGKVKVFEQRFERSGVKNYASRQTWARRALDAYNAALKNDDGIELPEIPADESKRVITKPTDVAVAGSVVTGAVAATTHTFHFPWITVLIVAGIAAVIFCALLFLDKKANK